MFCFADVRALGERRLAQAASAMSRECRGVGLKDRSSLEVAGGLYDRVGVSQPCVFPIRLLIA
jgi:hypothetical protein